jgi:hypothetical protein
VTVAVAVAVAARDDGGVGMRRDRGSGQNPRPPACCRPPSSDGSIRSGSDDEQAGDRSPSLGPTTALAAA